MFTPGLLEDRPLFQQLLLLLSLALMGSLLLSALGIGLASLLYPLDRAMVLAALSEPSGPLELKVLKLVQGFSTVGTFLLPALVAAPLFARQPERLMAWDRGLRPLWLLLILLPILSYSMGALSDLLYRGVTAIPWPEDLQEWQTRLQSQQQSMNQLYDRLLEMLNPAQFIELLILMALLPAVAEEALFRGVLQGLLQRRLSGHAAVWLSALLFGLMHAQFYAFLSITVLGAVLGYLRWWSGSLWVPTLLHFLNNASIVVLSYGFGYRYSEAFESNPGGETSLWEYLLLLALFGVSLGFLHQLFRQQKASA